MNVESANEKTREEYKIMAKQNCLYYWETNSEAHGVYEVFHNIGIRMLIQHHKESVKNYRDLVLKCVSFDASCLEYVSDELRDDEEIVLNAVKRNAVALSFASKRLQYNPLFEVIATGERGKIRQLLLQDKIIALKLLRWCGLLLEYIEELNNEKEIVLEAVKNNGDALQFADVSLRNDVIFAKEALSFNFQVYNYLSESLQQDLQIIEVAIDQRYPLDKIKWSSHENNKELFLKAIQVDGEVLKFASIDLQNDRDLVLAAVSRNGMSLRYASNELRKDRQIVLEAISSNSSAFNYANGELQEDDEIIHLALNNGLNIYHSNNRKLVLESVKRNGYSLADASQIFQSDREIVLESVKRNGNSLADSSKIFQSDREIVQFAIESDPYSIRYASEELQNDLQFISLVLERGFSLEKATEIQRKNRNLVLACVKKDGKCFNFASSELQKDAEIITISLRNGLKWNNQSMDEFLLLQLISSGNISNTEVPITIRNKQEFILRVLNHLNEVYNSKSRVEYLKQVSYFRNDDNSKKSINASVTNSVISSSWKEFPVPCYELFSEYISNMNNVLKLEELREWGRRCKSTLKWARNVPQCVLHLSKNYQPSVDLELLIYFSNYRPKTGLSLLFTKVYPKELCIQLTLLKEISEHITKFNYTRIEPNDYNKSYYLMMDFINQYIIGGFFKSLPELINYQEINSFIFHISDIFPKKTLETFISAWLSLDNFPKFQSLIGLLNENKSLYQEERKFAQTIRNINPQYIPISVLGIGAEGIVFKCYDMLEKQKVAFKIGLQPPKIEKDIQGMSLLRKNIEGVIHCYDCDVVSLDGKNIKYVIMEKGKPIRPLLDAIYQKNGSEVLNRESVFLLLNLFSQVLTAVNNIHNANFAHRDLKLANMVYAGNSVKIIDLDSSRVIMVNESCTLNIGTLRYLAPELYSKDNERILQNTDISKNCDMFSLGCILLEILTRSTLILDSNYCNDSSEDSIHELFSPYGIYFHQAVSTQYLQHKLHNAIRLEIDKRIDSSIGLNTILSRIIITMIQQNSNLRGNCGMYLKILDELINKMIDISALDNENWRLSVPDSLLNDLLDFNKNIVTILKEENAELKSKNKQLQTELEKMKEELERLKMKQE